MSKDHHYNTLVRWTGNLGDGTVSYSGYDRDHVISSEGKPDIPGSSDPSFRGNAARYNPEEMLLASLSACHMLWYLHLCSEAGVIVTGYRDAAEGTMKEAPHEGGAFSEVTLHPAVKVSKRSMIQTAQALHEKAHDLCYIARSVNFSVKHLPLCESDE